ncbi:VCBS repeat-containing protein [Myxococcota bacterium]|nr:VCBS repeat-containing protein [Myxococcota bacterium]
MRKHLFSTILSLCSCGLLFCCTPTGTKHNTDAGVDANNDANNQNNVDGDVDETDSDGDGVPDHLDACPNDINQWTDADSDGQCDEVDDACPADGAGWTDADGDGHCDQGDDKCPDDINQWTDADADGHCDELDDDCPGNPNGWVDSNGDGFCDGNDDNDGDGIRNYEEENYGDDCMISNPDAADSDRDGVLDPEDPYPMDPYPEYILHRNDNGTIDLMLSNRDGSFQNAVEIGESFGCTADAPHNCPANINYRYVAFYVSDFDNNGSVDFLAVGDSDTANASNPLDLWYFYRSNDITQGSSTTFEQRLVDSALNVSLGSLIADLNNDHRIDLVQLAVVKPANITQGILYSLENTGTVRTANCATTEDPANPNGCLFIRRQAADITPLVNNQWNVSLARDAVDFNGDGFRDLAITTMANGGDVAMPVYILNGAGDGTFTVPTTSYFSHNSGPCGSSPANSIVFGDFNDDSIGDIIMGFDDDGDPGSGWFYPGQINGGVFGFNFAACFEAIDINPANENDSDAAGVSGSAQNFDFNFDGHQDVILGWNYQSAWAAPSRTVLYLGNGNGTFAPVITIRDFPTTTYGSNFAIPQRLCAWFPID